MFILEDACGGLLPIVALIRRGVFPIIQIGIPIILIVMGSIDLGKAVLSSDDKEIKASTGRLIKRVVAAIAVFFIVVIVKLVIGWVTSYGGESTADWESCWKAAGEEQKADKK